MKKMLDFVSRLLPPKVPVHTEKEQEEMVRSIISMISTGNVSMQFGNCITEEMVADQRKQILGHNF